MKYFSCAPFLSLRRQTITTALVLLCLPVIAWGADRTQPIQNATGAPVRDASGQPMNYGPASTPAKSAKPAVAQSSAKWAATRQWAKSGEQAAATGPAQPFWQYAIWGSGIGASNILIGPAPTAGTPEIIVGGNSSNGFGADDFWQSVRWNPATKNYDQVFVSPIYSASIKRIALGNLIGDSNPELVVMLSDGRIYVYDFATKAELGSIDTGVQGFEGLCLTDVNGDGFADLIVTTPSDLYVADGTSGQLLWSVAGVGGYDVVAGQMDNDPALEIATTSGNVIDVATHAVQWTRSGGFGAHLRLAPLPGANYQQLIAAESWQYVYSYDIARQLPRWSINTPQDIGALQIADVDNDGLPEVIIGDGQWGNVRVYDLVTQAQKWATHNPEHGVTNIAVGDTDGDGVADLLWGAGWTSTGSDYLYVANTVGLHDIKWRSIDLQGPFLGPLIGDLDGDGKPELVVCSYSSESDYSSGRILVFDLATLTLRGISAPVVNNYAWTGVHDLKLRDVDGDGRMEIVVAADYLYDGVVEIYSFDASNQFTRTWTNSTRPSGSPFNLVEVADLDGNGTQKIIAGNTVAHTGSPGVYLYIYDYPSGAESWHSVNMASGFNAVTGLVVQDLDGNGSKEIAALVGGGDLYTFNGPSRQLVSLVQRTGWTLLSGRPDPSGLISADQAGLGHFLQFANDNYTESFSRQLGNTGLNGINALKNGALWIGRDNVLDLRPGPSYDTIAWQSPITGSNFGRFVATDNRNGQECVFSSARHAIVGLVVGQNPTYALNVVATNGTVTKGPEQAEYPAGSQVTLTANPNPGYIFTGWSGDASGNANPLPVAMDSNKSITANFAPRHYTLALWWSNGFVTKSPDQYDYTYGTKVTLTAVPATGYAFSGWSGDASGNANPLTMAMDSNKTITATFVPSVATPTISPNGGTFTKKVNISVSCATSGAKIYYTTDGSDPTTSSAVSGRKGIKLTGKGQHTVKVKAIKSGYSDSAIASATFTIN